MHNRHKSISCSKLWRTISTGTVLLVAALTTSCASIGAGDLRTENAFLKAQADAWDQAIIHKDRAAIEANMALDFRQIGSRGNVQSRESFIEGLLDPLLVIDPYTVEDFEIRRYGETALLSGSTRMTGRYAGEEFQSHYRYIDIYVRQKGEWKVVNVQTTRIAE